MFHGAQQPHHHSAVKPTNGGSTAKIEKIQRVLSVLQLLGGVTIALFLAGVVVPSFVRSGMAATHDSAAGSLHALTIGGVTSRPTNLISAAEAALVRRSDRHAKGPRHVLGSQDQTALARSTRSSRPALADRRRRTDQIITIYPAAESNGA